MSSSSVPHLRLLPNHWDEPAEMAARAEMIREDGAIPLGLEPWSLPWFGYLERKRYSRHGNWIPAMLGFTRHVGEHILCHGPTLGTDWARYAQHGAKITVVDAERAQLDLVRRHLALRGLDGLFRVGELARLPFSEGSFDVACVWDFQLDHAKSVEKLAELYRVLKPGGKLLLVREFRPNTVTSRQWRRLLGEFAEVEARRRHLRRSDLPTATRWFYMPWAERFWGRFQVVRAFKPVRGSMAKIELAA